MRHVRHVHQDRQCRGDEQDAVHAFADDDHANRNRIPDGGQRRRRAVDMALFRPSMRDDGHRHEDSVDQYGQAPGDRTAVNNRHDQRQGADDKEQPEADERDAREQLGLEAWHALLVVHGQLRPAFYSWSCVASIMQVCYRATWPRGKASMNAATSDKSRVLIVDDEPGNIKILSSVLAGDYALSVATGGAQALQVAEVQLPDIVLLDMVMPEMDGIQVCEALKAKDATRDIPVIFVTSMSDSVNEERGFDAGAVDYISKPISPPIVKARVKIHIQNYLSKRFLEKLLSDKDTTLDDAKKEAESLLVFV